MDVLEKGFNPRTYIRYDKIVDLETAITIKFQSTYLYKVRQLPILMLGTVGGFNPRTYIRYDQVDSV